MEDDKSIISNNKKAVKYTLELLWCLYKERTEHAHTAAEENLGRAPNQAEQGKNQEEQM